jgi:NADH-quinone oxidoreductase subunit A
MVGKGLDTFPAFLLAYCGSRGQNTGVLGRDWTHVAKEMPVTVEGYYPIAILLLIAVGMASVLLWLPSKLAPKRPNPEKLSPYECGMPPVGDARERFNIWFYIIGMEFIIFDVEIAFLYPWAVAFKEMKGVAFLGMAIFLGIIALSLVYAWKRGALQWE